MTFEAVNDILRDVMENKKYNRQDHLSQMSDSELSARSSNIDLKIEELEDHELQAVKELSVPALERLKAETDEVYLSREAVFVIPMDKFAERFDILMKGRKDVNKIARGLAGGLSFNEITKVSFGGDPIMTQIWLNFLRLQILEPEQIQIDEKIDDDGETHYTLTEKKKRTEKLEEEKPKPKLNEFVISENRILPLLYVASSERIHLDVIISLLGQTKINRDFTWTQAVSSLRLVTKLLGERVRDEAKHNKKSARQKLSQKENDTWNQILNKVPELLDDSTDIKDLIPAEIAERFRNYISDALDPRYHPEILWPSSFYDNEEQAEPIVVEPEIPDVDHVEDIRFEEVLEEKGYWVTEKDLTDLSFALWRNKEIHVKLDGEPITITVPDQIRESALSYLRRAKRDITSILINPDAIDSLNQKLSSTDTALEYIEEQEFEEIQNILFWLEENQAYMFRLLPHLAVRRQHTLVATLTSEDIGERGVATLRGEQDTPKVEALVESEQVDTTTTEEEESENEEPAKEEHVKKSL